MPSQNLMEMGNLKCRAAYKPYGPAEMGACHARAPSCAWNQTCSCISPESRPRLKVKIHKRRKTRISTHQCQFSSIDNHFKKPLQLGEVVVLLTFIVRLTENVVAMDIGTTASCGRSHVTCVGWIKCSPMKNRFYLQLLCDILSQEPSVWSKTIGKEKARAVVLLSVVTRRTSLKASQSKASSYVLCRLAKNHRRSVRETIRRKVWMSILFHSPAPKSGWNSLRSCFTCRFIVMLKVKRIIVLIHLSLCHLNLESINLSRLETNLTAFLYTTSCIQKRRVCAR